MCVVEYSIRVMSSSVTGMNARRVSGLLPSQLLTRWTFLFLLFFPPGDGSILPSSSSSYFCRFSPFLLFSFCALSLSFLFLVFPVLRLPPPLSLSLSFFLSYFLFIYSMELHKNLTLDPNSNRDSTGAATHLNLTSTNPMAIPLTQLVPQKQPAPSSGVPVHPSTQLSHLASAPSALPPSAAASLFSTTVVTDHHNSSYATQSRVGGKNSLLTKSRPLTGPIHGLENGGAKKAERKFAPYWEEISSVAPYFAPYFAPYWEEICSVLRGKGRHEIEEVRVNTRKELQTLELNLILRTCGLSLFCVSFVFPETKISFDTTMMI